jgi:hypothetical protein
MIKITHKILWSARYQDEHKVVLEECRRVSEAGGTFQIENTYTDNWYSIITVYYPEASES